jgi:hypothetical protein
MVRTVTEEEFGVLLASFRRSAFRFEAQDAYALDYEQADFERFLAGKPASPREIPWWRGWLDQVSKQTLQGKTVRRVRVLAEPPTSYQQWMLWAGPWYERAHEEIRHIPRSKAVSLHLPLEVDWWLLDDEQLILMYFGPAGEVAGKLMVTESGIVARHREWRDLAVRNSTPAEDTSAA